jgi:preprotein translocase subunit SecF
MQIFKSPHFNFMRLKYIAFAVSGIVIAVGLINIFAHKGLNYGVDFAGGTLIQIRFKTPYSIGRLRQTLTGAGFSPKIQEVGKGEREYIIRTMLPEGETEEELEAHEIMGNRVVDALKTPEDLSDEQKGLKDLNNIDEEQLQALLEEAFPERGAQAAAQIMDFLQSPEQGGIVENYEQLRNAGISSDIVDYLKEKTYLGSMAIKRRETVGPQVGAELRRRTTQATVWALLGMLIYIGIRFKFAYGVSAILTLAHDVLVTVGIFSLTSREINLPVIAAILTIVGYSLNDTIVIFDRVRDNLKILRKTKFGDLLNTSINQTLSRTTITSGTTLMTVLALFIFGGEVINDFAFTMMIGVIVGTYSSIYMSCSLLYFWKIIFKPKKGMGK